MSKIAYVCNQCGADYSKWMGQCSTCKDWNSIVEVRLTKANKQKLNFVGYAGEISNQIQKLNNIALTENSRFSSSLLEFDRVLGGGLVPGSSILIGGSPGAGKSTLLLEMMCHLAEQSPCLYVTGEESLQQVAMRANRLKLPTDKLYILAETSVEEICQHISKLKPQVVVIDSIQVMYLTDLSSSPGSVTQVRECATYLTRYAKQHDVTIIMVGHVTKDGSIAGPKVLEHCIDCSLLLEGESDSRYRTLRCHKNRFGSINELGVFAMTELGLREIKNPSAIFLNRSEELTSGNTVVVLWEGTRPLLVEIQTLVDISALPNPRRLSIGVEQNRLSLLLAVLHRHGNVMLANRDVFINVVGGIKITETSADLAILLALVSSSNNKILPQDLIIFGEVGLGGEIRPVVSGQERIREASKHGFTKAIVPYANRPKQIIDNIKVYPVKNINEALDLIQIL